MLVRNHIRDVWNLKYDVAYHVVQVMGRQLELMDQSCKTDRVNVQDIKILYPGESFWMCSQVSCTSKTCRGHVLVHESKYIT